ncbi:MAG: outer membrane lipid asymmetry maintenance protein MlaD [gamma proteobacterium symbiont of Ctena orbiculata]|uniref:outer membrane lipid asymmetry maintenance protein MlaD n=1 Tax=Candidatus Thiodiazotropha sp. CDECU1 TaxID=3065865 RepID=UPI000D5742FB|nr:outer membrane lipid asymmetry maintenance protein MlaD [Candidatus Thiodiazotropha sp. CDECU1]PVV09013.1 MAG: outer membrane lipid asymmetry maintenance protein MlaD [gamma proteobacterium symbiont of Ctena orbiculata]PVV24507.1 MAG: outer membrane lipid asymmetry maintenance protein MlaD [gamma proteobacterium symbiont of Ctena orbiculata]PVV25343.1 MAG: outer membrane lipid asymmetry maintenance protein MlaD [gamma proteobacterium symbiont of Ctena orbiculata]
MNTRGLEITVGAFMAAGLVALFFLAMQVSNLASISASEGYEIKARFDNIGGLKVRSQVSMAGVRIGRVVDIDYDQESFEAVVTMSIDPAYSKIPDDSIAKIYTSGLLGEQYIGLDPGGSLESLQGGSELMLTQSALVLEEIIGQFLFSKAEENAIKDDL